LKQCEFRTGLRGKSVDIGTWEFWAGRKKVFLTGHTGFKGSWLSPLDSENLGGGRSWLLLPPPTQAELYDWASGVGKGDESQSGGRTFSTLDTLFAPARNGTPGPTVVFPHFGRPKSIVRRSLRRIPTRHVCDERHGDCSHPLDRSRPAPPSRGIVMFPSDKCYENCGEGPEGYRESDRLGALTPYSSSTQQQQKLSHRPFFAIFFIFAKGETGMVCVGSRGNVIGGGVGRGDRLIPECGCARFLGGGKDY